MKPLLSNKNIAFGIACVVILAFLSGCATVPITGRKQLSLVSHYQMLSLGETSYEQLIYQEKLSHNQEEIVLVNRVGARIAASADEFMRKNGMQQELRDYNWQFILIDDDENANAFCLPGGKIGIYSGILKYTQDDDGLAVVMSHEVAHALANHGGERMSQLLLLQLGGATLAAAMKDKPQKTQQYFLLAYGIGANLGVMLPYSRLQETEADYIGLVLMAQAGYDPRKAIDLWQRLNEDDENRPPAFLSTHPAPQNRIENIKRQIPYALGYYNSQTEITNP
jgi:predicted Zn-dependent protease